MRLKKNNNNFFFHPFEMSFCGFSDSGKTTLISRLTRDLSSKFDIGFLKHDAHNFEMDKSGKDTYEISISGAKSILINDKKHYAHINKKQLEQIDIATNMQDMDILFVEDHIESPLPKLVFISKSESPDKIITLINDNKITDIEGIISDDSNDPFNGKYPFFNIDKSDQISSFILNYFNSKIPVKINGLVLSGGKSIRMNEDKGALTYHNGENQVERTKKLLDNYCDEVYVSCRADQTSSDHLKGHNLLIDAFPSVGPTTGIISAQYENQSIAWLVVACDLPYLTEETIANLIAKRNPFKLATAYHNKDKNWPEPLCTIYEPKSYQKLLQYFSANKPCPRKVLFNSNIESIELIDHKALRNINTPKEKTKASKQIICMKVKDGN
jgi:molybdopterin-guanine dinucleotide biosynthesis protein MobB